MIQKYTKYVLFQLQTCKYIHDLDGENGHEYKISLFHTRLTNIQVEKVVWT